MYAIPGNHDWYDGLGAFLKLFCQKRWTGNWETHQRRSYFALRLPHRYWVWATDIQLNSDIDEPQKQYFRNMARTKMYQNDKVILITAEPAWVHKELYPDDQSYEGLQYFIQTFITEDKIGCIGKTFDLVAVLTGDLHHFSHYRSASSANPLHYIGAGGGGAYMHLTHKLPKGLKEIETANKAPVKQSGKDPGPLKNRLREENIELKNAFPSRVDSVKLVFGNLLFFVRNPKFSSFMGFFYATVFWLLLNRSGVAMDAYLTGLANLSFAANRHQKGEPQMARRNQKGRRNNL